MAIRDDSESVQITKCSLDDLLMSLKANKMALNSAVYMEDVDGKCSLREVRNCSMYLHINSILLMSSIKDTIIYIQSYMICSYFTYIFYQYSGNYYYLTGTKWPYLCQCAVKP